MYGLGVWPIFVSGDHIPVRTFWFWCVVIVCMSSLRIFVYTCHGGHIVNGCGSHVDVHHVVGTPGAGGVFPLLLCYLEGFYPCCIVAALSVICAMWGWLCAGMTR